MFWTFMLITNLLIPVTMIGLGRYFLKNAPSSINMVFGYRTARSMINMETWHFAHRCIGRIWYRWGLVLIPFSVLSMLIVYNKDIDIIGIFGGVLSLVQCLVLVLTIIPVERALIREFDEYGRKRYYDQKSDV